MVSLDDIDAIDEDPIEELGFSEGLEITSASAEVVNSEFNAMCSEIEDLALREIALRRQAKKVDNLEGVWVKLFAPELMRGITQDIPIGSGVLHVKSGIIIGWE